MAWTILNDLTSSGLSSVEERGDVELLHPANEVRETIKSPVSAAKVLNNSETTKDKEQKRAMETASVSLDEEHQHAVISFAKALPPSSRRTRT